MVYDVQSHRLRQAGKPVPFQESPNKGGTVRPLYLIMHYTAGTSADGAIKWLADARAKASAHLVVDRSGSVTQLVPFNRVAWHAGKSRWNELDGMNAFSLGIEIVNAGKLRRNERGQWVNWASNIIPDEEVTVATHKNESFATGWQIYTQEQLDAVIEIGLALNDEYDFLDVLGHDDVSPGRKVDPGPAFPMTSVQSKIMGRV